MNNFSHDSKTLRSKVATHVRFKEASLFSDKFAGKGRLVRSLSISLAAISIMFASFVLFFDNTNTDYLYDELIPAQQNNYDDLLTQGGELLSFNDLNNAVAMFEQAYDILPQHTRTIEAVDLAVDKILEAFDSINYIHFDLSKH